MPADIASLFISEISEGMYAYDYTDPFERRTSARAGIIKIATDEEGVAGFYEKIFIAAVSAHRAVGAPILTHADTPRSGYEQAAYLVGEGAVPGKIIISHMDRNIDYDSILRTAELGVSFSFDTIARYKYHDNESEIELFRKLIEAGYADRILVGLDCTKDRYAAYAGEPGFAYLPGTFPGMMKARGISKENIDTITVKNPRRILAF